MPMTVDSRHEHNGPTRYHLQATKSYLIKAIQANGSKDFLDGWTGTDEEAIQAIQDDPREVFAVGACDHFDAQTGRCLGHPNQA